jgi:hypothetical protein
LNSDVPGAQGRVLEVDIDRRDRGKPAHVRESNRLGPSLPTVCKRSDARHEHCIGQGHLSKLVSLECSHRDKCYSRAFMVCSLPPTTNTVSDKSHTSQSPRTPKGFLLGCDEVLDAGFMSWPTSEAAVLYFRATLLSCSNLSIAPIGSLFRLSTCLLVSHAKVKLCWQSAGGLSLESSPHLLYQQLMKRRARSTRPCTDRCSPFCKST